MMASSVCDPGILFCMLAVKKACFSLNMFRIPMFCFLISFPLWVARYFIPPFTIESHQSIRSAPASFTCSHPIIESVICCLNLSSFTTEGDILKVGFVCGARLRARRLGRTYVTQRLRWSEKEMLWYWHSAASKSPQWYDLLIRVAPSPSVLWYLENWAVLGCNFL